MEKILQVGDVVYRRSNNYGTLWDESYMIDRVTDKRAFSGHNQFSREFDELGELESYGDTKRRLNGLSTYVVGRVLRDKYVTVITGIDLSNVGVLTLSKISHMLMQAHNPPR